MSNMSKILHFSVSSDSGLLRLREEFLFLTLWKNKVIWIKRIPRHEVASLSAFEIDKEFPCSIEVVTNDTMTRLLTVFNSSEMSGYFP